MIETNAYGARDLFACVGLGRQRRYHRCLLDTHIAASSRGEKAMSNVESLPRLRLLSSQRIFRRRRQNLIASQAARRRLDMAASPDRQTVLQGLASAFAVRQADATRTARRASRIAPILTAISAGGTAFAGVAVATNLTGGWRTAIIVVAFVATGVGAGAAALRPTERAQAARSDAANASALLTWLDLLATEEHSLPDNDFRMRVQALRAWDLHQLGSQPFTYDGATPWTAPAAGPGTTAATSKPAARKPPAKKLHVPPP
jgi:hypothetical protein